MIFYIITYPKFFCQRVQFFFSNILENLTENLFVLVCQSSAPRLRRLNRIHNKNMSQFSSQFEVKNCTLWQLLSEKWYYKMLFSIKFWTTFYYFIFFAVIRRVIIMGMPVLKVSTIIIVKSNQCMPIWKIVALKWACPWASL